MLDELQEPAAKAEKDYWDIIRRRRWWFFIPFFCSWVLFIAVLYLVVPPGYRSEATILVTRQSVPDKYVPSNVDSQLPQRLQSMTQQILSRTKLQKIIQDFSLFPSETTKLSPDEVVDKLRSHIDILPVPIDDLAQEEDPQTAAKRALTLAPGTGKPPETLVFRVSYSANQPHVAQRVTDALVSVFIEENLAQRQRQSETTTNFLQSQVEQARVRLSDQEARLQEFKHKYLGQLPEQKESNLQVLSSLQTRMQSANDALNRAQQQKVYLESLSEQYDALQASLSQGDTSNLQSPAAIEKELQRLHVQLTNLQGQYTERHPDVVSMKDQIAQAEKLKEKIEGQIDSAKSHPSSTDTSPHPTSWAEMQQLSPMLQVQGQLKSNAREIETAQNSIKQLGNEITGYQARLDLIPMREQELQAMSREYDQARTNFEALLAKQNDSEVATNLEKRQEGQQFVILHPPSLPPKPNAPDRFMLGLTGLGIGFGIGLMFAILSELLEGRVHSHTEVAGLLSAPILVGVPQLQTSAERRQQAVRFRLEWASASIMALLLATGTALTFYHG